MTTEDNAQQLTEKDAMALLQTPSASMRKDISQKITHEYNLGKFVGSQVNLAEDIFRFLVKDVEVSVRNALSESLSGNAKVPHDVIQTLARDISEVANPVLERSEVLTDEDLVEIIATNQEAATTIAKRQSVSETLSSALVDTNNENVVDTLLHNDGATISKESTQKIVKSFGDSERIGSALVANKTIPIEVLEGMIANVSDELKEKLQDKIQGNAGTKVIELIDKSREMGTLTLLCNNPSESEIRNLVNQLHATDRLTFSIVVMSLCIGNMTFFIHAMAKIANAPVQDVQMLLNDKSGAGFHKLYDKVGFSDSLFDAVKLLYDVVASSESGVAFKDSQEIRQYINRMVEKILMHSEEQGGVENIAYILAIIKNNPFMTQ